MYCKFKNVWNTVSIYARYFIVKFALAVFGRFRIIKRRGKKNVADPCIFFSRFR